MGIATDLAETGAAGKSRYFIALLPPAVVQAEATAIQRHFQETYQSQGALRSPPHVTLQPPFEWPREGVGSLRTALTEFASRHQPVPLAFRGFGAFPPKVIFIQVLATPELMALQPALMAYLEGALGIREERSRHRRFVPHLTVAFRDLKPWAFRQAWPEFEQRPLELAFEVVELTLLRHTGQRWQVAETFPFRGGQCQG